MICIGAVIARSLVLVAALALGTGCNGKTDSGANTTLPPPPTASTTPADPYAVPAVIDEAYVNRVLAGLDQVRGDAVRRFVAIGQVDAEAGRAMRSIYNDPQYAQELEGLVKTDRSRLKTPPGNRRTTATRVLQGQQTCILAEVSIDFSEVALAPPPRPADEVTSVTLRPTQPGADIRSLNPTPWSMSNADVLKQGALPSPENQCAA
jgi:hypothetical protein